MAILHYHHHFLFRYFSWYFFNPYISVITPILRFVPNVIRGYTTTLAMVLILYCWIRGDHYSVLQLLFYNHTMITPRILPALVI